MTGLVNGVVVGRVTKVDPAEDPGWLEIEFQVEDGNTRQLARVATAMAGDQRGTWLMPEVSDEVLVAFQNGHPAAPYVIGYLWNGAISVPETTPDKRVMKSKLGHTLTFDDSSGDKIEIRTNDGHTITLDDSSANKIEIKASAVPPATPHTVTLDNANQKIEIKTSATPPATPHTITMDSTGITLRAGGRQLVVTPSSVAFT